jgi:hypothetical protein
MVLGSRKKGKEIQAQNATRVLGQLSAAFSKGKAVRQGQLSAMRLGTQEVWRTRDSHIDGLFRRIVEGAA